MKIDPGTSSEEKFQKKKLMKELPREILNKNEGTSDNFWRSIWKTSCKKIGVNF